MTDVLSRGVLEGEVAYFWKRYAIDPAVPLPDTAAVFKRVVA